MGDRVQARLEGMIPELEGLLKSGIFSKEEIKAIVKRRRHFEYLVSRRSVEKIDYIRYLQYETQLEQLKQKRKYRLGIKRLPSLIEFSGPRKIHSIFHRALSKFKWDLSLWHQYLEFSRNSGSTKTLNRAFARALQLHPLHAEFWSMAAWWEFEHNHNMSAARTLLQRGLRFVPDSDQLWHSYFRLELAYLQKIVDRLKLVGGGDTAPAGGEGGGGSIDVGELPTAAAGDAVVDQTEREAAEAGDEPRLAPDSPFLRCAVPRVVYRNAVRTRHGQSLGFHVQFLAQYAAYPQLDSAEARREVLDGIRATFPLLEEARDVLARSHVEHADDCEAGEQRAVAEYELAVQALPTPRMWELYAAFVRGRLGRTPTRPLDPLLAVYRRAHAARCLPPLCYRDWVDALLQQGLPGEAALATAQAATEAHPAEPALWLLRLQLTARTLGPAAIDGLYGEGDKALLAAARHPLEGLDHNRFWQARLEHELCARGVQCALAVLRRLAAAVATRTTLNTPLAAPSGGLAALKGWFVRTVAAVGAPAEQVRAAATGCLSEPPVTERLFRTVVAVEQDQPEPQLGRLRALYQEALARYGAESAGLWMDAIRLEQACGDTQRAAALYSRAKKALHDPTEFMALYDAHLQ